jgi:hypothetical protein
MPFLYYIIYKGAFMGDIVREIVYKKKALYTNQKRLVLAKEPQYKPRWRSETPYFAILHRKSAKEFLNDSTLGFFCKNDRVA